MLLKTGFSRNLRRFFSPAVLIAILSTNWPLLALAAQQDWQTKPIKELPDRQPIAIKESIGANKEPAKVAEPVAGKNTAANGNAAGNNGDTKSGTIAPVIVRHGQELSIGTDAQDLVPTDDVNLARQQVSAFPDSPEASFILAVALTRTSHVEEALQEVKRARKLADKNGGPDYFDKMIATYEDMLKNYPKENRVRYGLAWAYYMKAYLLAQKSAKIQKWNAAQVAAKAAQEGKPAPPPAPKPNLLDLTSMAAAGGITGDAAKSMHIEGALEKAEPSLRPQIKQYYEAALTKLDELLVQKPDDIWAKVYRAFLKAEYTGDLNQAMITWQQCRDQSPNNPAPYFFLGEGYLRQGNLKECFNNVSKAIALRSLGN